MPTVPPTLSTVNAPELVAKGLELEFGLRPRAIPGLSFDGSVVYNDTRYSDFPRAPCFVGQPQVTTPTNEVGVCARLEPGSNLFVQNVSGLRTVGSAEWQANITGRYEVPVNERLTAFGQANFNYSSSIQYSVGNPETTIQRPYGIINLTAGVGASDNAWRLSFYIKNLTDKRYVSRIVQSNPSTTQGIPFSALRSFGTSLDVQF